MTDNLFSHPADAEHVKTKNEDATKHTVSTEPVQHPVFSDKSR